MGVREGGKKGEVGGGQEIEREFSRLFLVYDYSYFLFLPGLNYFGKLSKRLGGEISVSVSSHVTSGGVHGSFN